MAATAQLAHKRTADSSVGYMLWQTRLDQGYDLNAIAEYLKIRPNYLHAIEQDNFRELPSGAFAQCYIRTYAEFLELNGEDMLRRYLDQTGRKRPTIRDVAATPQPVVERGQAPVYVLLSVALGLVVTLYAGWVAWQGYQQAEKRINKPVELPAAMVPYVTPGFQPERPNS